MSVVVRLLLVGGLLPSGVMLADAGAQEVDPGTTLTVIAVEPPPDAAPLDPQRVFDLAASTISCCLARALMGTNGLGPDEGGNEVLPDLAAAEPEVARDGLSWTFRLRPGLRYAPPLQGTEITSRDLVRALERVADADVRSPFAHLFSVIEGFDAFARGEADAISGLETPDPRTLITHLTEPTGDFAYRMALPATAPIAPVAGRRMGVAEGHDDDLTGFNVSSGPYMFESAVTHDPSLPPDQQEPQVRPGDRSWVFVRNPSWDPATDPLRPAIPDRIVFDFVSPLGPDGELTARSEDAMFEEVVRRLLEGEADVPEFGYIPIDTVARHVDAYPPDRIRVTGSPTTVLLTLNVARPPFDDVHVRRAVAHVLDRDALREDFGDVAPYAIRPSTHILPNGIEDGLLLDYAPYLDGGDTTVGHEEMARSRYDSNGDGVCDGEACRIALPAWDRFTIRAARQLESIGVQIRRIPEDVPETGVEGVPALTASFWWPDLGNAGSMLIPMVGSGGLPTLTNASLLGATPQQLNAWGYEVDDVPSVDDRLAACLELVGPLQTDCWARLDQYLMEEIVAVIPFGTVLYTYPISDRVEHLAINAIGVPQFDRIELVET